MKTVLVEVSKLERMAAPYNPRIATGATIESLRTSLRRWGCVEPVIVNKESGSVVGGHQRIKAAALEGIEKMPVVYVHLDSTNEKAMNLALNKISGDWDHGLLEVLIDELATADIELTDLGFLPSELNQLDEEWKAEKDFSGEHEYDPDKEEALVRVSVLLHDVKNVVDCVNDALKNGGYSYTAGSKYKADPE